ncbi:MAG: hypothetical protein M3Q27_00230, partial [Actinomycetota bacterium]|nr:hypothetical protein [Actinomycetota bacterium]
PLPARLAAALDGPVARWSLRVLGLVAAGYVAVAALAGPDLAINPTAHAVYVLFWIGLVPASVLLGPVWRRLNPLRTVHVVLSRLLGAAADDGLRPLPPGLGYWPAALGLLAFVWLELVAPDRATLPVLRTWFAVYVAVHLLAAAVYGTRWFDRGDGFEVWSALYGSLSVLGRRDDGVLVLRSPLDGAAALRPAPGLVAVVSVALGSTAFDGISNAPWWFRVSAALPSDVLASTLGLLVVIALVAGVFVVATAATAAAVTRRDHGDAGSPGASATGYSPGRLAGEFAHSLVPIALGYVVAHYYSLFVLEGQRALILLSDPLSTGADVLGTAQRGVDSSLVTPSGVASIQVLAVVTGHVLGVVLAHDRALRLFPRRRALAGQLPLLAVMVAYTIGGLVLLFVG